MPSFINDTDDSIRGIRNIIDLPSGAILVTFRVISPFPSIPHDFRLRAFNDSLLDRYQPTTGVKGILYMTELVFKVNVFEFNSQHFLQTSSMAIDTKKFIYFVTVFYYLATLFSME